MTVGCCTIPRLLTCALAASAALGWPLDRADADVLTVFAVGRIDPVCEISVLTPIPAVDFAGSGETNAKALLNCNTGFVLRATSANGALKNSADAGPGFTNSLNYKLTLTANLTGSPWVKASCASARLVVGNSTCALSPDGPGMDSGGFPSVGQSATLKFSWVTPTNPRLVAGNYEDTITISIAAAP